MKRILLWSLLWSALSCQVKAQMPGAPGPYGAPFGALTPAQADWVNQTENFSIGPGTRERPTGDRVSVARLRHKPPAKAISAFSRGVKFAVAEAWAKAALEFERAIEIDADFSEAHGNLGSAYSSMGQFEKAAVEFRRAIALDPVTGVHYSNLAYVLIRLGRPEEAQAEARTAVSLNPTSSNAQYLLGFLLARAPATRDSAVAYLGFAARELPEAHFVLGELYEAEGKDQSATGEYTEYRKGMARRSKTHREGQ